MDAAPGKEPIAVMIPRRSPFSPNCCCCCCWGLIDRFDRVRSLIDWFFFLLCERPSAVLKESFPPFWLVSSSFDFSHKLPPAMIFDRFSLIRFVIRPTRFWWTGSKSFAGRFHRRRRRWASVSRVSTRSTRSDFDVGFLLLYFSFSARWGRGLFLFLYYSLDLSICLAFLLLLFLILLFLHLWLIINVALWIGLGGPMKTPKAKKKTRANVAKFVDWSSFWIPKNQKY